MELALGRVSLGLRDRALAMVAVAVALVFLLLAALVVLARLVLAVEEAAALLTGKLPAQAVLVAADSAA